MMDGLLIVDKPPGMTSHDVVNRIRRLLGIKRVGHFGTLDPMATGVLLLAVGKATRLFDYYRDRVKVYEGVAQLGWSTDSYDATGKMVGEKTPVDLKKMKLQEVIARFLGQFSQTPPVFSAKKKDGKPLYHYARQNIPVELKSAEVTIYELNWRIEGPDRFWFSASTSSGTYIRSLIHDIGQALGCGGHLAELRRTAIGEFTLQRALPLDQLTGPAEAGQLSQAWEPIESLLPEWSKLILSESGAKLARNGNSIPLSAVELLTPGTKSDRFRIFDQYGTLIGLGAKEFETKSIKPFLVLA